MFDIFGNVFGKSKKSGSSSSSTGLNEDSNRNRNDGYVFVGTNDSPYSQATILTDEVHVY